jgi:deoxyhypusine synthase
MQMAKEKLTQEQEQRKVQLLSTAVQHIDITKGDINYMAQIEAMQKMSFVSRETGRAAAILEMMVADKECSNILVIAGSATAGGCMDIPVQMVKNKMVNAVVVTGATVIDMDLLEALGFKHYIGTQFIDDHDLADLMIDRIYDTFIDEVNLQEIDHTIKKIADTLQKRPYSSREFIWEIGKYLCENSVKKDSLIQVAYEMGVPIFVPAFSDCSAGFGLALHQHELQVAAGNVSIPTVTIDSVKDFLELTKVVIKANLEGSGTGLFMIGGGSPKNFAQDTVVCAEIMGYPVAMHKYAVQITVADVRDGACSSSTLREAHSWGKVDTENEQMVYAEATTVWPIIAGYAYQKGSWKDRGCTEYAHFLNDGGKLPLPEEVEKEVVS